MTLEDFSWSPSFKVYLIGERGRMKELKTREASGKLQVTLPKTLPGKYAYVLEIHSAGHRD
jgi:hypothetical protein